MEQELQKLIQDLFKDYENNSKWVNISIGIILGLINIIVGLIVTFKIENYKLRNNTKLSHLNNELSVISKRTEIKYKDNFESQIKSIKQLYEKYVNLEYSTKALIKEEFSTSPHDELKSRMNNWYNLMIDIHVYYNRNRIIFPDRIKMKFGNHLYYFEKINKYLSSTHRDLNELEAMYNGDHQYMYESEHNEEDAIIGRLKAIKNRDEFKNIEVTFDSFKKLLEKEYKQLIK